MLPKGRKSHPFCVNGHDKKVVGVYNNYACKACSDARSKAAKQPTQLPIPNLRSVRELHGLTVMEFAELSGLSFTTVYRIEQGKAARKVTRDKIIATVIKLNNPQPISKRVTFHHELNEDLNYG